MSTIIKINEVSIGYGNKPLQRNISANIQSATNTLVIGPNGCGKSTFLKTMLNIIHPISGQFSLCNLPHSPESFAYLGPRSECSFDFTIADLIEIQKDKLSNFDRGILNQLHIENLLNKRLSTVSTGELQRVLIFSTITQDKEILILDEPFQNLDVTWIKKFCQIFRQLNSLGKTIIYTSHNFESIIHNADKILCLSPTGESQYGPANEIIISQHFKQTFGQNLIKSDDGLYYWNLL